METIREQVTGEINKLLNLILKYGHDECGVVGDTCDGTCMGVKILEKVAEHYEVNDA